ncbi:MAG: magnesium and cobalt exporter, family [Pseudonocardiales bacterium]|jgi:CBS domain containing-hemolysin-like protein|nr:magnesium and cobalt exporter, family [Pseudonocardiales bacterium]MDT7632650.1 magnesium and cobalt exporter, family [Pseudonocardiales bacterium]MDT7673669.1 magnesium and cobalt exporter, family [Pseudonocardiales bacterium]
MTTAVVWQIVLAVLLVPLAGLFAAADSSLGTVSRARVEALVRAGKTGARQLAAVVADRPRYVNLLLLLRLACETVATVLATIVAVQLITPVWLGAVVAGAIMVVVSYVLIGVGPRTIGRQHPYGIGLALAAPVRALAALLGPLTRLLIVVGNAITPGPGFREGPFSSEVELREAVDLAGARGVVAEDERQMIHSVFELGDTPTRDVMVPRTDLIWIERHRTVRDGLTLALRSGYSRIPVLGEGVDDVIGVVYLKDLAAAEPDQLVSDVMRPATFVPDSKPVADLLKEMQRSRYHMAIVVDEYGGTAGVVTIEDILEEIVGEITDEYDTEEIPPIQVVDEHTMRVAARLPVADLGELFGLELEPELTEADVDTVGGLLAQRLGRVPLPGARAEVAGLRLLAEGGKDARGRIRITTVLVTPVEGEQERTERSAGGTEDRAAQRREGSDVTG